MPLVVIRRVCRWTIESKFTMNVRAVGWYVHGAEWRRMAASHAPPARSTRLQPPCGSMWRYVAVCGRYCGPVADQWWTSGTLTCTSLSAVLFQGNNTSHRWSSICLLSSEEIDSARLARPPRLRDSVPCPTSRRRWTLMRPLRPRT